jgi:hypothetical protein
MLCSMLLQFCARLVQCDSLALLALEPHVLPFKGTVVHLVTLLKPTKNQSIDCREQEPLCC